MHIDKKAEARHLAEDRLGIAGYLLYGKEIIPETKPCDGLPTIVGYLFDNGVAIRKSVYENESTQICAFERQVRERGLSILTNR